jgi:hypothetical protein
LGSIVKNYTKVPILQKLELGKLSLEDTIDQYELGFPTEISSKVIIKDHSIIVQDSLIYSQQSKEKTN